MVLASDDLERLADDIYKDRRIGSSVYCGNCGYNLRTLPYVYQCPECGQEYNARPLTMRGIFRPYEAGFPIRDIALALICAASAALLIYTAVPSPHPMLLVMSGAFVVLTVWFTVDAIGRTGRFVRAVRIARRIAAEQRE